ncbi:peptidylprolyl isomerase [Leptolyngbya sp. FACHB-261]|uniref:peptidylprolyl isomerase n=1 Tax=Leptolyngbya sp. FACHB-261 TaxID=2692806 RepID=UPI0016875A16|nr:peptidylprolyl isomerase [Leptolyngbya sp. FACHB-261]MBD2100159.1 peptidylprolyl isomerase [Leptolyngbya sp. FACHB-261]
MKLLQRLSKLVWVLPLALLSLSLWLPPVHAALPANTAISDPAMLLRRALPIDSADRKAIGKIQENLEDITPRLKRNQWGKVKGDLNAVALAVAENKQAALLKAVPEDKQAQAQAALERLRADLPKAMSVVEGQDKDQVRAIQAQLLSEVDEFEATLVKGFPFKVPDEYASLPQLKGRATVEVVTSKGPLTVILDGYSAPLTAGNFVDLVQRGFYDGLPFIRSEESYVLQTGDPAGPDQGFVDPSTGQLRTVPLEVRLQGEPELLYGITTEDAGLFRLDPVLPFSSFGAVAMARAESDVNSGSSQFFFFLFEPELTPAGRNLLDGRYAIFGYTTQGAEVLRELKEGDKIVSARVVSGAENLVQPTA